MAKRGRPRLTMPWFPLAIDYFVNDKMKCYSHAAQMVHLYLLRLVPTCRDEDGFVEISKLQPRRIKAFFGSWSADVAPAAISAGIEEILDNSDGVCLAIRRGDRIAPKDVDQFRGHIIRLGNAYEKQDERAGDDLSGQNTHKIPTKSDIIPTGRDLSPIDEMKLNEMKSNESDPEPPHTELIDTDQKQPGFDGPQLVPGSVAHRIKAKFPTMPEDICKKVALKCAFYTARVDDFDGIIDEAITMWPEERSLELGSIEGWFRRWLSNEAKDREKAKPEQSDPSFERDRYGVERGPR